MNKVKQLEGLNGQYFDLLAESLIDGPKKDEFVSEIGLILNSGEGILAGAVDAGYEAATIAELLMKYGKAGKCSITATDLADYREELLGAGASLPAEVVVAPATPKVGAENKKSAGLSKLSFTIGYFDPGAETGSPPIFSEEFKKDFTSYIEIGLSLASTKFPENIPNPFKKELVSVQVMDPTVNIFVGDGKKIYDFFKEGAPMPIPSYEVLGTHDAFTMAVMIEDGETGERRVNKMVIVLDIKKFRGVDMNTGAKIAAAVIHEVAGHIPDILSGIPERREVVAFQRSVDVLQKSYDQMSSLPPTSTNAKILSALHTALLAEKSMLAHWSSEEERK